MYQDYAIDKSNFHWQSQSKTTIKSITGQRYINHKETENHILLFVREYKTDGNKTMPYIFLGRGFYDKHYDERPINFVRKMEQEIPQYILKNANMKIIIAKSQKVTGAVVQHSDILASLSLKFSEVLFLGTILYLFILEGILFSPI